MANVNFIQVFISKLYAVYVIFIKSVCLHLMYVSILLKRKWDGLPNETLFSIAFSWYIYLRLRPRLDLVC